MNPPTSKQRGKSKKLNEVIVPIETNKTMYIYRITMNPLHVTSKHYLHYKDAANNQDLIIKTDGDNNKDNIIDNYPVFATNNMKLAKLKFYSYKICFESHKLDKQYYNLVYIFNNPNGFDDIVQNIQKNLTHHILGHNNSLIYNCKLSKLIQLITPPAIIEYKNPQYIIDDLRTLVVKEISIYKRIKSEDEFYKPDVFIKPTPSNVRIDAFDPMFYNLC
jgi:hypothetical protein